MAEKRYYTRVKNDHPVYGNNSYVCGVVMGIMSTTVGDGPDFRRVGPMDVSEKTGDHIMNVKTTEELYQLFAERVEKRYPGLCEFDCEKPVSEIRPIKS